MDRAFFELERDSDIPLYQQVKNKVMNEISRGSVSFDGKLLSERSLARFFKINRATARRAIQELSAAIPLVQIRGKGTFLAEIPSDDIDTKLDSIRFIFPQLNGFTPGGGFFYRIWSGADAVAREEGTDTILSSMDSEHRVLHNLNSKEGLVVVSVLEQEFIRLIIQRGRPVCLVDCMFPNACDLGCDEIQVDSYGGACLAVEHLIQMGHNRIAAVTMEDATPAFIDRYSGYADSLQKNGIQTRPDYSICLSEKATTECFQDRLKHLMAIDNPPTAIFAFGDWMCFELLKAARIIGIGVPEDVSLIGFGDSDSAACSSPTLTSVNVSEELMGQTAARRMLQRVRDPLLKAEKIILPTRLAKRESVAVLSTSTVAQN